MTRGRVDLENLSVRPAPDGRLSGGLVVDASIQARLLGLRILTLNAQITLVPAEFAVRSTAQAPAVAPPGDRNDVPDSLAGAARTLDHLGRRLRSGPLSLDD